MRVLTLLLVCAAALRAQDPFEIVICEYEPLPLGAYFYEAHANYVLDGTKSFNGPVAPTQDQLHFTSEWTTGITDSFRAGFVLLTAKPPGKEPAYAGLRFLPRFYAPRPWGLPLNLGLVTEFSFEHVLFDENAPELEIRGIVEKHLGRLQTDGISYWAVRSMDRACSKAGILSLPQGSVGNSTKNSRQAWNITAHWGLLETCCLRSSRFICCSLVPTGRSPSE